MSSVAFVVFGHVLYLEHIEINMKLSEKLKLIRRYLKLPQDQLAKKLGMTEPSRRARVSEWESGKREPKRQILLAYANILNLDVKKLLDDDEDIDLNQ